ncbi:hypothetical protein Q1J55_01705 [Pseudomonas syringae]|uniref:hypothetical protein n=1 Tax=Pseudomonas syringae TaxID=317 RepID=UPI0011D22BD8|nr:hypothetical protein [Pseudomonas syringae]MDF7793557.1 hypothetical protein [Pseudomonas syringae]
MRDAADLELHHANMESLPLPQKPGELPVLKKESQRNRTTSRCGAHTGRTSPSRRILKLMSAPPIFVRW